MIDCLARLLATGPGPACALAWEWDDSDDPELASLSALGLLTNDECDSTGLGRPPCAAAFESASGLADDVDQGNAPDELEPAERGEVGVPLD